MHNETVNQTRGIAQGQVWGEGERVVLMHGSLAKSDETFGAQRPLAEEGFQLIVPDRYGYRGGSEGRGEDFLRDADDVVELLGEGAHLVGHSYGAIGVLLAAARRPEAVRSLAVTETPAFGLRPEDPAVVEMLAGMVHLWSREELDDRAFLEEFFALVGVSSDEIPDELLAVWTERAPVLRNSRPGPEAEIPVDRIASAPFPKLVFSGGHHAAFDAVCDELTDALDAERKVIKGAGHEVQMTGEPFNEALLELWRAA